MRKSIIALLSVLVITSMLLGACGGGAAPAPAAPAEQPAAEATTEEATTEAAPADADEATAEATTEEATTEAAPADAAAAPAGDRVQVRWFIGLGTGADAKQIPIEEELVKRFNESQDKIELVMEVVPNVSCPRHPGHADCLRQRP